MLPVCCSQFAIVSPVQHWILISQWKFNPDKFCMQIKFGEIVKKLFFPCRSANFQQKADYAKQGEENSIRFPFITFFHNRLFSPKKSNFACPHSHTHNFLSIKVPRSLVPTSCRTPAARCVKASRGRNARESIHFSSPICIIKNHFSSWQWLKSGKEKKEHDFPILLLNGWMWSETGRRGMLFKLKFLYWKVFPLNFHFKFFESLSH